MERILIIQTAFPGDAILTLPMIQELKKQIPESIIDVICIPSTKSIFDASPFINKSIVLDKRKKHKSVLSLLKFANEIKGKYNQIISPHRSFRTSLIVFLSGIKNSTGFDTASFPFVYKRKIFYDKNIHEVKRNLSLLGKDVVDWKIRPEITVENKSDKLIIFLSELDEQKYIVISPGSVWDTKKYPEHYYLEVTKKLIDNGYRIIFSGGPAEKDLCKKLKGECGVNSLSIAGEFSIPESIEIFKKCVLVLSNDSAPTHMAAASGTPVLTLYCSTIPDFGFYPYLSNGFYLSDDSEKCKPCGIHGHKVCPEKHFNCATKLTPDIVLNKINQILNISK